MRNIFIDAGSFDGRSARLFRQQYGPDWEIHCFEPDPRIENRETGITLHREAVWVHDGESDFHLGQLESSTLIAGKSTGEVGQHGTIRVSCLDLSRWLTQMVKPDDRVFLKLNIEGAEYPVLNKMIEQGTIALIGELAVEWHFGKIPLKRSKHQRLVQRLKSAKVNFRAICGTDWLQ